MLVRAKHLAGLHGGLARVARGKREAVYYHLLFDAHQIILANDSPTESFCPDPEAIRALNPKSRATLSEILPDLELREVALSYGPIARPFAKRQALPDGLLLGEGAFLAR